MARIENTIRVDRPVEEVWALLGDLGRVAEWVPGIASARIEGSRRICTMDNGGGEIQEEITVHPDPVRSYSYTQPVHPLGFEHSSGTLAVEPDGSGARVLWHARVEFADPDQEAQIAPMLEQGYRAALESLKAAVESA